MYFSTFPEFANYFRNKLVDRENFMNFMKSYYFDYIEILNRKNIIIFQFEDFDIKINFKKLTDKKTIRILNIIHC